MKALLVVVALFVAGAFVPPPASAHYFAGCRKDRCKKHVVAPHKAHLVAIAGCESGKRWYLDGAFDGGLQFSPSTWGKTGSRFTYAWQAPILEQLYRGVVWAHAIGWAWRSTAGWPNCG